jgi:hypothetical protein
MTAKELNTMVNAMRTKYNRVDSRMRLEDTIYYLSKGLHAIGKNELAEALDKLYSEIDEIDTDELIEIGTFR